MNKDAKMDLRYQINLIIYIYIYMYNIYMWGVLSAFLVCLTQKMHTTEAYF